MNKLDKKWIGFLFGVILPFILVWLVIWILATAGDYSYKFMLDKFINSDKTRVQIISLSAIGNLGLFYLFLKKNLNQAAMGVIFGTMAFVPYIIYIKFIA